MPTGPLYVLAHDLLFLGQSGPVMRRAGFLPATRENAHAVLASGGVTIVFPGGETTTSSGPRRDRPPSTSTGARATYVRRCEAGVPIVPVVSIGGQEDQIHLSRGELHREAVQARGTAAHEVRPGDLRVPVRAHAGVPAQPAAAHEDPHTRCSSPIDIAAEFGEDPDIDGGRRGRSAERMQTALNELKRRRRFPVLG